MTNQLSLPERLRCVDPMDPWSSIEECCNLAAAEIERLTQALTLISGLSLIDASQRGIESIHEIATNATLPPEPPEPK